MREDERTAAPFQSVRRTHAADDVFEQLAAALVRGEWRPGETLPPERVMAERFGVSRVILRQAIHRLADIGLVRVRQGGGTVAVDPREAKDLRVIELLYRAGPSTPDDVRAMAERQLLGAHGLVHLAARRVGAEEIAALREIVGAHARSGARDEDVPAFERDFFCVMARATHNRIYQLESEWWFALLAQAPRSMHPLFGDGAMRVAFYGELLRRLEAREDAAGFYLSAIERVLAILAGEPAPPAKAERPRAKSPSPRAPSPSPRAKSPSPRAKPSSLRAKSPSPRVKPSSPRAKRR